MNRAVDEDGNATLTIKGATNKFENNTAEGRAYNRRVDVILLDDGHF